MQRSRSSSVTKPRPDWHEYIVSGTVTHGFANPPTLPGPGVQTTDAGKTTKDTVDVVTKDWRTKISNGEIINNPFKTTWVDTWNTPPGPFLQSWEEIAQYTCYLHSPSQKHNRRYEWRGKWRPGSCSALVMDVGLRNQLRESAFDLALTDAHANVDTSDMMVLATVAEAEKTVKSMSDILKRVIKILKAVRKLDLDRTKRNLTALQRDLSAKKLADDYMAARYALRPLYYDARGLVRALGKGSDTLRKTYHGAREESFSFSDTLQNVSVWTYIQGSWIRTVEYKVSARAGVLCDVNVSELSGFGLDLIGDSMWELVPFSFIADWFGNTGDLIAAHMPNAGVTQRASWVTVREELTTTQTLINPQTAYLSAGLRPLSLSMVCPTWGRKEIVLERSVDPRISTWPRFDLNVDAFKLIDLGIIARGITKGVYDRVQRRS